MTYPVLTRLLLTGTGSETVMPLPGGATFAVFPGLLLGLLLDGLSLLGPDMDSLCRFVGGISNCPSFVVVVAVVAAADAGA